MTNELRSILYSASSDMRRSAASQQIYSLDK